MILSYRKREDSPTNEVSSQCDVVKNRSRSSVAKDEPQQLEKKQKPVRGFWFNFFRPIGGAHNNEKRLSRYLDESIPPRKSATSCSSSSSRESVNTILSTHSFSFVNPKSYGGRQRKRGRRIPVEVEDKNFRPKPQKPQLKQQIQKSSPTPSVVPGGTLSRIGIKFGLNLKSKYHLQSCESLAVCGTDLSPQNCQNSRSSAIPGPSRCAAAPAQSWRDNSAHVENVFKKQEIREEETQNSINCLIGVKQDQIPVDSPKKRRAPLPPVRGSSITNTLDSSRCKKQEFKESVEYERDSRAQQRHRRCQSDSAACDRFKPRLHVRGKRRAPTPPTGVAEAECELQLANPLPTLVEKESNMRMRNKKKSPGPLVSPPNSPTSQMHVGIAHEQKPIPRPWYRRNPAKSPTKLPNPKPIINLPNFSKLDKEAAEIVEENRRRSAELNYKQTAKELITMFNSTFSKVEETGSAEPNDREALERDAQARPHVDIIRSKGTVANPPECEEKKKLAVVQPQKSEKVIDKLSTSTAPPPPSAKSNVTSDFHARQYDGVAGLLRATNEQDGEQWTCPRCTLHNSSWRAFCDACFFRRGSPFHQITNSRVAQTSEVTLPIHLTNGHGDKARQATKVVSAAHNNEATRDAIETETTVQTATNIEKSKDAGFPPCQNFLHQVPNKKNLPKEKMLGVKLLDEAEGDGELDISALREARLAFFAKNSGAPTTPFDYKPNNCSPLEIGTEFKELNLPPVSSSGGKDEGNDDLEVIDFLLKINQEADSTPFLNGTWKSTKFRPSYAAISENNSHADTNEFELIYEDLRRTAAHSKGNDLTDTFMRTNIQSFIRNQLDRYKDIMDEEAGGGAEGTENNLESMVEACRKQGAVPKHLIQGHGMNGRQPPKSAGNQSHRKGHAQVASDLLRKLDWAISHGEYRLAAKLAYQVATLKVEPDKPKAEEPITIRVYVEDRMMQQGPFLVSVTQSMTVGRLKTKIEADWSIPTNFQKWILGKKMAEGDDDPLAKYSMQNESLAFLYLITPEFGNREVAEEKVSDSKVSQELKIESKKINTTSQANALGTKDIHVHPHCDAMEVKILNGPEDSGESSQFTTGHPYNETVTNNPGKSICSTTPNSDEIREEFRKPTNHSMDNLVNFNGDSEFKKYDEVRKSILVELPSQNIPRNLTVEKVSIPCSSSSPANLQAQANDKPEISLVGNPNPQILNSTDTFPVSPALRPLEKVAYTQRNSSGILATRRTSIGESQNKHVVHVPFTRRLSGTLTKQIQMFEALNSPQLPAAHGQKSAGTVSGIESLARVNGVTRNTPESHRMEKNHAGRIEMAETRENAENYKKLLELEKSDLIRSDVDVDCPICLSQVTKGQGVVLRDCLHSFCQECLAGSIEHSEDAEVKCPFRDNDYACESVLQEREIKALVPIEVFHRLLAKSVKIAECKMSNAFHCQTNDCPGWCVFEDTVNIFLCPVCSKSNCLNCRAIHQGLNCQQYQRQLAIAAETDEDAKSSRLMLEKMIERGEALDCPACHVVLLKKWGCDWVRCSYCKTEICWVTKSFRWGPNGKGDNSGGCKCGVNGVKCHPKCTYCH